MNKERLLTLLSRVKAGEVELESALDELKHLPYEELGFAKLDHHRTLRRGFPEVIFCSGKTLDQIGEIFSRMVAQGSIVMASRADAAIFARVRTLAPEAVFFEQARIVLSRPLPEPTTTKKITIITAGTSDIPVAEEAAVTARTMGNPVETIYDVGVAGMHRFLAHKEQIQTANVIVVVAGMEGALASVVGGMVDKPIVAVPTSVGYGAAFEGLAALLAMLNSCAPGVAVVNIDNGFGAGYYAGLINQMGNDK
jgi:hypothetical protein